MSDHGTTSIFPDWYIRFQQAALAALPRPPELDQNAGLGWADNGEVMKRVLAEALLPKQSGASLSVVSASELSVLPTYPAVGEIFELTLDGDAPENRPLEMVRRDGYNQPEAWRHTSRRVKGTQTRSFKLVSVGHCCNFKELTGKLISIRHGMIPKGQWREAFKAKYPESDGKGPIGVADSSWVDPCSGVRFPYISATGISDFNWVACTFGERWRWLVETR